MLLNNSSTDLRLQLAKSNILGKDGFTWWVGQVAALESSEGKKVQLISRGEDQTGNLYYGRVKVRIIGYHTANTSDLPDKGLPWAHIMIPPGTATGTLNTGQSHEYKGGETVLGFFLDGDDAATSVASLNRLSISNPTTKVLHQCYSRSLPNLHDLPL